MAGLPARGRRALEQLRLIAADASSADLLAARALAVLDTAVPFDDGALFAVDESSLLFTRLLAYRGEDPEAMRGWLRDVYLVAREPGALHFPTLLRQGGAATFHEDGDRWLRAVPPPVSARALIQGWRQWESPAGGALRYGLAHRRRWVAAVQLARLEPGRGFRPGELEFLDRAAPTLARALAARPAPAVAAVPQPRPAVGHAVFDEHRRLVSVSASGERWIGLLARDALAPEVPVALQALVGHLAGSALDAGTLHATDRDGGRVALRAEPALRIASDGNVGRGYAVTIAGAVPATHPAGLTGAQWEVARAVARGDSDQDVAAALHLSAATVHEHVSALHRLLGTSTRPRLVATLTGGLRDD